ncbi:hypothetical protein [Mesorhizobium sp.]|uniref:hypothetical protein n=1 Tax=Mesorhizobium sp. TaxID=1871066 RepID=UPI000FE95AF1|nr:hypothetical protein [Mesorhizobium sp.]RWG25559.1 MAG: hypothetical protein EOQ60_29335 [Mesorhizobium sp.]
MNEATKPRGPHIPPVIPKDIAMALKALDAGKANEGQQRAALDWIMFEACGIRNLSYQPGDVAATAFAEGRRFAGLLVAGALQASPAPMVIKRVSRGKRQEAQE